ncbi:MAG: hypothetical protein E7631_01815 [Ruminococcaceae bacterium]|nr:hypothetical protein [Oscillospiraceae bacterium]
MTHKLFTPLPLRHITLPGRAVRSATELFAASPDAHLPAYELEVYKELSVQPLGMIITAHTCVSPEGRSNLYQNAVWADEYLAETAAIAEAAQANGVPAVMQLGHGGMKAENHNGGRRVYTPDNMTKEEIASVVKAFGQAAARAMKAGFSGVMLHAAHMYLLSQCFYPEYNHRTDEYGGSAENRFRIIREIIEEIKTVCGDDTPVFMKINGDDRNNTEEYHRDIVTVLQLCETMGLEAAEISGWSSARQGMPEEPYFIHNIRRLRKETALPLIAVGGIRTMDDIEDLFDAGADAVSMARPFLQDPGVLHRLAEDKPSGCIGCCACFKPLKLDADPIVRCPHRKK